MGAVFVISMEGERLMPTFNRPKVRRMLQKGKAVIFSYRPFTIQLTYKTTNHTQDIEFCSDAGAVHEGISIKSEKHEYVHLQADMLPDEKQRHDDRRKYRRGRRNRKRYRKPRFNNRTASKKKGWLAPSVRHRVENQVNLYRRFLDVCPVTQSHVEVASFDTQALEAIETGKPLPSGADYQTGPRYGFDTLREAVFARDKYTCALCGKNPFDGNGAIMVIHHALYWKGDHTDRMSSLMTLCTGCHTAASHAESGPLWGMEPDNASSNMAGSAFMNIVRWAIIDRMREVSQVPVKHTYGAITKRERLDRNIEKSHANDAYCIGKFRPKHRTQEARIRKRRRNDRILEKFYDATYTDLRDGSVKTGKELSCGRTKRKEPRHGDKDLRPYRKDKLSKGYRSIRKKRYDIRPGDQVLYNRQVYTVNGTQNNGKTLQLITARTVQACQLQRKTDKKGNILPVEAGQKLALIGRKEKHRVLSIAPSDDTVVMEWYMGVKPNAVKRLTYTYGGWKYVREKA